MGTRLLLISLKSTLRIVTFNLPAFMHLNMKLKSHLFSSNWYPIPNSFFNKSGLLIEIFGPYSINSILLDMVP